MRRLFVILTFLLALPSLADAHDSLQSTLSLTARPTGIDLQVFMSRASAAVLIAKPAESIGIMRDNFPEYEKRLSAAGPDLLTLAAGDNGALTADASVATLTDEDDICFRLHYPLPVKLPVLVTIHGTYLAKMDAGHVGSLYALNASGDALGNGDIEADSPDFVLSLPAVGASQPKAPATIATVAMTQENPSGNWWPVWALTGVAAAVMIFGIMQRLFRARAI